MLSFLTTTTSRNEVMNEEKPAPVIAARSVIEITAPSDLAEGYVLPVDIGGELHDVVVVSRIDCTRFNLIASKCLFIHI